MTKSKKFSKTNTEVYGTNQTTQKSKGWNNTSPIPGKVDKDHKIGASRSVSLVRLDKFIRTRGISVHVYRTSYCPKTKSVDASEHEIDCNLCNGSGYIDRYPIKMKVLIASVSKHVAKLDVGYAEQNAVYCTLPLGIALNYFTKIELDDFTEIQTERFKKSSGSADVLRYYAKRVHSLIDYSGKEYLQNIHFKINSDGNILWEDAQSPNKGMVLSVSYEAKVQFRATVGIKVNRYIQVRRAGQVESVKLPEKWLLQKEFAIRKKKFDPTTGKHDESDQILGAFDDENDYSDE